MALARHWVDPLSKAIEVCGGSGGSLQQLIICAQVWLGYCLRKNQRLVVSHRNKVSSYFSPAGYGSTCGRPPSPRPGRVAKAAGERGHCQQSCHLVKNSNLPRVSPKDESRVAMVGGPAPKNIGAAEV